MSWLLRGIQSAIFHYASCTPCTGYMYRTKRRKEAKRDRNARRKLQSEQPDLYPHPGPTGTNPYWTEEIVMGPGPPPRRARRTNTGTSSRKGIAAAASLAASSINIRQTDGSVRLSDDTLDDDNWNRRRYQREDEILWGFGDTPSPPGTAIGRGSSVGVGGTTRPGTSKSSAETYCTSRKTAPTNQRQPPIVRMPSNPSDYHWMLQPPPKASIMSGKERSTHVSRSGSGSSSRVELSLQRQVSARQLQQKVERGETPDMPPISRCTSYGASVASHQHDGRPKTPQTRPASSTSSRARRKRRDTGVTRTAELDGSSGESSRTVVHTRQGLGTRKGISKPSPTYSPKSAAPHKTELHSPIQDSPGSSPVPSLKLVRVRSSLHRLSTVLSSGSGSSHTPSKTPLGPTQGNQVPHHQRYSNQSSDSLTKHDSGRASSDMSSLSVLQDLVSPRALLNSRFVSAPLMEARIRLPPSDQEEEKTLSGSKSSDGGRFEVRGAFDCDEEERPVPFDSAGVLGRDPRLRWSVDF